jgi:hypothetical protein
MVRIPGTRWMWMISFVVAAALISLSTSMTASAKVLLPSASTALYVSPQGNDSNPGTQSQPIQTLQHARDLVRAMNTNMSGDITVYLASGTYRLSQPLALDQQDSGTNGHNIIYTAVSGQQPIISGGVQITGWKVSNSSKNIWSAPAPSVLKNTRQLYVNGVRAHRTSGRLPVTLTQTSTGYTASAATMASWRNPGDIEFVYTGGQSLWSEGSYGLGAWTEPRCPVASISGTTITMAQPCWDNSTKRVNFPAGTNGGRTVNLVGPGSVGKQPEYVENAFELLSQPGQWYFDRSAGTIYYIPRSGENLTTADVEAPVLETLISGNGTTSSPIHNIVFSGLQFSYATWLRPSSGEGFSEIQANYTLTGSGAYATQGLCQFVTNGTCPYGAWTQIPGNLSFSYDNHIQFLNDGIVHLGAAGLALGDGSQSDTVQGNVFTDISGNGLSIGNVDIVQPTSAQLTSNNQVLDNHFFDLPMEFHGGVAISNGYTQSDTISHNQINHTAYSAISIGWGGWPNKISTPAQSNPSQNNTISDNLIYDQMQLLADGGAIYTNGLTGSSLDNGEKITGNVIYNQLGPGKAIYTDNGTAYITIKNNVLLNNDFTDWGTAQADYSLPAGQDGPLDIEGNYWQQGNPDSSSKNVVINGNHIINSLSQAPSSIVQNAGVEAAYKSILSENFGSSVPEAPARVAAFAGNGFAYVTWNPPVSEGYSGITSYTVTSSKGDNLTVSSSTFRTNGYVKLTGLTNGTGYTFTVTATNGHGTSVASLPSNAVTPNTSTVTTPAAPGSVSAYAGPNAVSVHFRIPSSDGGSPVIAYKITTVGGPTVTVTGYVALVLSGTHTYYGVIQGLTNGQTYTFNVAAVNVAGAGTTATVTATPSATSATATPTAAATSTTGATATPAPTATPTAGATVTATPT